MRFSAIHKLVSYLMCAAAFLALALSGELSPVVIVMVSGTSALSWFVEPSRWRPVLRERWTLVWNVLTLAVFAASVLRALRGELLSAGVSLICFLLINKLFNRRASRDYQHAYVLSFLMLVAGAALSADLTYALCFLLYVVFATWTLTLFHLRREMEDNYLLKHSDDAQSERVEVERILNSRRIVGGSFLAGTALVSLAISIVSCIVFFLIPRFGFGFFATRNRKNQPTVGFTDRVELGEYGAVRNNPQVVLRVELPAGQPSEALHFRGVAFDRYQNGNWNRSARIDPTSLVQRGNLFFLVPANTRLDEPTRARLLNGTVEQRMYLDPLDTSVLFGATRPVAFELPAGRPDRKLDFKARQAGEIYAVEGQMDRRGHFVFAERKSAMRYTVYSRVGIPDLMLMLSQPGYTDGEPPSELRPYLSVPTNLPKRVLDLAAALVAGSKTKYAKARAVEKYLQTRLRYTLDLKRDERYEPIEDFLFVQKAGHCEYFASAMAVMLRTVGLPTRMVSGFYGGEWNEFGKYLAVRQSDAHAWVEVWLGEAGWVTFDPTPPSPSTAGRAAFIARLRQMFDTVELAWFKYVIEYDLGKQAELALGARRAVATGLSGAEWKARFKRLAPPTALVLIAAIGGFYLVRRTRPIATQRRRAGDAVLARALDALERRGLARGVGETARELGRRAELAGDPGAMAFVELVERCYAVRYGAEPVPASELARLLEAVRRAPPRRPPARPPAAGETNPPAPR